MGRHLCWIDVLTDGFHEMEGHLGDSTVYIICVATYFSIGSGFSVRSFVRSFVSSCLSLSLSLSLYLTRSERAEMKNNLSSAGATLKSWLSELSAKLGSSDSSRKAREYASSII